jgi:D-alanyl-lipoteichoic acid acyltransferase DltB (MBOAT superfamily)
MAIGLAYLLGFEFPQNFNSPYKATSISDFWRRWHMTLSRWLKDYLYIPLGGRNNRAIALAATMLLGGLWHGAEWTFVAWGAYHAILLELHHHLKQVPWLPKNKVWAQIGTFLLVTIGWVFFRPPTFHASWTILTKMFNIPGLFQASPVNFGLVLFIVVAGSIAMLAPNVVELIRVKKAPLERKWAIIIGILTAACILFLSEPTPFLYYQF